MCQGFRRSFGKWHNKSIDNIGGYLFLSLKNPSHFGT
jgi:hypothetical protein